MGPLECASKQLGHQEPLRLSVLDWRAKVREIEREQAKRPIRLEEREEIVREVEAKRKEFRKRKEGEVAAVGRQGLIKRLT
jgi:hypothetical protein